MTIEENFPLKKFNSFGINASAAYFGAFTSTDELSELLEFKSNLSNDSNLSKLVLGGGSNILFTKNFDGLVLKNNLLGVQKIKEDDTHVYLKAGAGVNWHSLVLHSIENNWQGLENLSLIPGNTGASPMQNIGAYGVEIKDVFYELEAFHIADKKLVMFNSGECEFGYRESVFKRKYKNQFVILNVTFRLNKQHNFNTSYGAIAQELEAMGVKELSIQAISRAVINIRSSKLPDPKMIGNAGSFFKNPEVSETLYASLKEEHPEIVGYHLLNGDVKLAAGWMIEQAGWKGYRKGDAGCHGKQALVLVNYGNASGKEVYDLSTAILKSVHQKFNVLLEREVNIV